MVRKQISLFLNNAPGELGRLASLLGRAGINIQALSIQDASAYVTELFNGRGKTLKRIASAHSYDSMRRDSEQFALIRLLADQTEEAAELLARNDYIFDVQPVIAVHLENHPGALADIAAKFGEEEMNIQYVYGSVAEADGKVLFVFCPDDMERAAKVFGGEREQQWRCKPGN